MRVAIAGAGPTGLLLGAALARRGHRVVAVDRDSGPPPQGPWQRRGVMQFHHAHAVRVQVIETLLAELPEAHERWIAAGAEPVEMDLPGQGRVTFGARSRRETLERAIRATVELEPGVDLVIGHVRGILERENRAAGLVLDSGVLEADLVVDASGRSGRVTAALPAADGFGAACGVAYVDRVYRLHPGTQPGPLLNPLAWQADFDGFQVLVFMHERGYFSVLFARDTSTRDFVAMRHDAVFEAVVPTIPGLAEWTDPARAEPVSRVLPGGELRNHYRAQRTSDGRLRLPGLLSIGDAVCTTTPIFGRGLALAAMQVQEVLRLLDQGADPVSLAEQFDDWCSARMRPWVEDHLGIDGAMAARSRGEDVGSLSPLPSIAILQAGPQDPRIMAAAAPYLAMRAGPEALRAVEPLARAVYDTGWRPPPDPGPAREEVLATIARATAGLNRPPDGQFLTTYSQ